VQLMSFNFNLQSSSPIPKITPAASPGPKIVNFDNPEQILKTSAHFNVSKPQTKLFSTTSTNTEVGDSCTVIDGDCAKRDSQVFKIDMSTSTDDFASVQSAQKDRVGSFIDENTSTSLIKKNSDDTSQTVRHKYLTEISNDVDLVCDSDQRAVQVFKRRSEKHNLENFLHTYLRDELRSPDLFKLKRKLIDLVLVLDVASKTNIQRNILTMHNIGLFRALNHRMLNDPRFRINRNDQQRCKTVSQYFFSWLFIYIESSFFFLFNLIFLANSCFKLQCEVLL
jgi:hypothetical protein